MGQFRYIAACYGLRGWLALCLNQSRQTSGVEQSCSGLNSRGDRRVACYKIKTSIFSKMFVYIMYFQVDSQLGGIFMLSEILKTEPQMSHLVKPILRSVVDE